MVRSNTSSSFVNESTVAAALEGPHPGDDPVRVREILARATELKGLDPEEVAALMSVRDPELIGELFSTARSV